MTAARDTSDEDAVELEVLEGGGRRARRVRVPEWVNLTGPGAVWIGIGLAVIGFALIGVAWGQIAGETQVFRQLPYVVSAGLTGVGVIMVGVTVINVATKRRDAVERERQMDRLVSVLDEVRRALEERGSGRRR